MLLARLAERSADETNDDVLNRLAGTNQAALADAFASIIKDPDQLDAARMWAFRGLRRAAGPAALHAPLCRARRRRPRWARC